MNQEFNREDNGHKFSDQFCETLQIDALEVPAVKVTLELGRFDLSVGELSRMAPGQIVKTGISSDQDVLLVVKDEVLVGGRLILVENELAFEVLWKK